MVEWLDFVELWSNPAGKAGITGSAVLMAYKSALSKSKEINAVLRTKAREDAKRMHHQHCKKYVSRKLVLLSTVIWKMISEFAEANQGKRIKIKQGSKVLDHIPSVYQRDYYEESRKILFEIKRKLILEDFHSKTNRFTNIQDREEFIEEYTKDFRELFLGSIHKSVAGYNDDVEQYESKYITFEYLKNMFESILIEIEKSYNIKVTNEKLAEKRYSVGAFNIFKIAGSMFKRRDQ
jgi:hypothetical protein